MYSSMLRWSIQHSWCWDWSSNTHKWEWVSAHLTHYHGHALQLAVRDIIKAIKIIRGTPEFKLNKLIKYSMVWNHRKQQVEGRQCTRQFCWQNIMPKLLGCNVVAKHYKTLGCHSKAVGWNFRGKSTNSMAEFYFMTLELLTFTLKVLLWVTSLNLKSKKFHFELLTRSRKTKVLLRVTNSMVKLLFPTFELLNRTWKILKYTSSY